MRDVAKGVMRRLRDSLEISGHDKNHPHAKQPDQDWVGGVFDLAAIAHGLAVRVQLITVETYIVETYKVTPG